MNPLYTRAEVIALIGYSRSTIDTWETEKNFPPKVKFGNRYSKVFYVKNDVDNWLKEQIK